MRKLGQIKYSSSNRYQTYELLRNNKGGGGLALGIIKELKPVWVREGNDEVEAITVQISVQTMQIRITNEYGPKNYEGKDKNLFFGAT